LTIGRRLYGLTKLVSLGGVSEAEFVYGVQALKLIIIIVYAAGGRDLRNSCFGAVFHSMAKGHVIFGITKLQLKKLKQRSG